MSKVTGLLTSGMTQKEISLMKQLDRRNYIFGSIIYTYSRQHGYTVPAMMYKYFEYLYPNLEDKERKIEGLKRQSAIFNVTPYISTFVLSLLCSMEKKLAEDPENFDSKAIDSMRAALQGPISGIGDAIYWVTWRVICAGLAIPFALNGSWIGALIFAVLFNLPHFIGKRALSFVGYQMGTSVLDKASESGILEKLTEATTIIGLIMVGGMVATMVGVPLNVAWEIGGAEMTLQSVFDGIMPGILPLVLTMGVFTMIRKKVNVNLIVLALFGVGILGAYLSIF